MLEPVEFGAYPTPRRRIDRALICSIVAIVISLAGTGVAAFEAYLTRQQQKSLLEQRTASIWPHIEALPTDPSRS